MINSILFRQASEADADAIVRVDKSHYAESKALSISYVKNCCELYKKTSYVATDNEAIIGFCIGIGSRSTEKGWISALTVLAGYKGKKIGEQLADLVCSSLNEIGCKSVLLTAEPNLAFYYEKLGFIKISELLMDFYGEGEDRYIMEKYFNY